MDSVPDLIGSAQASRDIARRFVAIGQNRLELLCVEVREERERIVRAVFLASGAAIALLLTGVTATLFVVLVLEGTARLWALGILMVAFASCGAGFLAGLARLRRDWRTLEETRNQLRLDRAQIEGILE